jgi:hypothetical protein
VLIKISKIEVTMLKHVFMPAVFVALLMVFGFTHTTIESEITKKRVSFAKDIRPIFSANCAAANCHAGSDAWMDLNFADEKVYEKLVNRSSKEVSGLKLILPFKPDSSYLLQKLKGTQIKGARMPYKREPLSAREMLLIEEWIKQGAVKN